MDFLDKLDEIVTPVQQKTAKKVVAAVEMEGWVVEGDAEVVVEDEE